MGSYCRSDSVNLDLAFLAWPVDRRKTASNQANCNYPVVPTIERGLGPANGSPYVRFDLCWVETRIDYVYRKEIDLVEGRRALIDCRRARSPWW